MTAEEAIQQAESYLSTSKGTNASVSTLSDEEIIRNLPDDVLLQHIQSPVDVATDLERRQWRPPSPYESQTAKDLFRGGGQMIGGLAVGALATPTTLGASTVPAAIGGGIGGAMLAESLRQGLSGLTGGRAQTLLQQVQQIGQAGMNASVGEALPLALGGVGKGLGVASQTVYRNIPDPVMQWVKTRSKQGVDVFAPGFGDVRAQLFPVLKRMGQAIQTVRQKAPQVQAPTPATLYPVAEKAMNALDVLRERVSAQYGEAASHALEQPARASLSKAGQFMKRELQHAALLDRRGHPRPFGTREFTSEEQTLLNAYRDLTGMSSVPTEGMPEAVQAGTFINYDLARRLVGRLDELMASSKVRNTQRILGTARQHILDGLKQSDAKLGQQIPEYGRFVGLRDVLESASNDPDKAVQLLLRSLKDTSLGLRGKLEVLDQSAPPELKFYQDLLAYQQKVTDAEVAKRAPHTVSQLTRSLVSPEQAEKLARSIFSQKETTMAELEALERLTGVPFLDELKDFAARQAFQSFRPTGFGVPTNLILGGLGFGMGGAAPSAVGLLGGTLASIPRVQARMLQGTLPIANGAAQAGQALAPAAPMLPPAIAALLSRTQGE